MRLKELAFIILIMIPGQLYAEEKTCGFPTVHNGRIAQYYYTFKSFYFPMNIDSKLSFLCLAGYTTGNGKQEGRTKCTPEGWSPEPRCFKKCTKPDLINGYIADEKVLYKFQENVTYRCTSGYKTTGGHDEEVIQCLPDGWSSQPSCTKEHETCLAPELHNGNYSTTQRTFKVKDKVQYECAAGYYTAAGKQSEEAECRTSGWAQAPKCTRRRNRCPPPPLPLNSKIQAYSTSYRHGEVVHIECELNFVIQGSEEIRCENGKWTEPPKCIEEKEKVACEEPPVIVNGTANVRSGTYYNGDKVMYRCERGYRLRGSNEITCTHGKWTLPPECVENNENCKPPPEIANGAITDGLLSSYTTGSSVEYKCNEYYLLEGSKISRCEQGKWSSPPVCLEPCTVDVDYMNRNNIEMKWKYEGKVLHGDLIDFVCKQGYDSSLSTSLSGLSVQCNRGEVRYPLCARKESKGKCVLPPLIRNGVIISSKVDTYENGSSVEYSCFEHHFLQGSKEIYCIEGVWTTPPVCLEPCTLSSDEMQKNNLLLKWYFDNRPHILHGEYIEFLCSRDTYIEESSIMGSKLRVQCNRGELKYPTCIPRERIPSYQEPLRT
ncbi:coagulation factor XIII B chain isoform X2 [Octodon degus]|uniref:Coagulation factor XIII B chain isoform X2 n=1 Tax=Octodon degus TaxID=10160 RepID=A0A6P6DWI7_OCTDE|nr:coagulation factor XIII B chain isoform X2 [Octodon degus]